jgi:hypothetical protein
LICKVSPRTMNNGLLFMKIIGYYAYIGRVKIGF